MSEQEPGDAEFISKNRLEALVDGVFAFAMTLLVVSLSIPVIPKSQASAELPGYLLSMIPEFVSYLIAFFILASFWIIHHRHFHFLRSVNTLVLWLNIAILIFVVLVPFTTSLSGDYSHAQIAVLLFHFNLIILNLLFFFQWEYIIRSPAILQKRPEECMAEGILSRLHTAIAAVVAIAVSFFSPSLSMISYFVVPLVIRIHGWIRHKRSAAQ